MVGALCYCQRYSRCTLSVHDATIKDQGLLRDKPGTLSQVTAGQMLLDTLQCTRCDWGIAAVLKQGSGTPGWMEGLPRSHAAACQGLLR